MTTGLDPRPNHRLWVLFRGAEDLADAFEDLADAGLWEHNIIFESKADAQVLGAFVPAVGETEPKRWEAERNVWTEAIVVHCGTDLLSSEMELAQPQQQLAALQGIYLHLRQLLQSAVDNVLFPSDQADYQRAVTLLEQPSLA